MGHFKPNKGLRLHKFGLQLHARTSFWLQLLREILPCFGQHQDTSAGVGERNVNVP